MKYSNLVWSIVYILVIFTAYFCGVGRSVKYVYPPPVVNEIKQYNPIIDCEKQGGEFKAYKNYNGKYRLLCERTSKTITSEEVSY